MVDALVAKLDGVERFTRHGRVSRVVGLVIEATGLDTGVGELCRIQSLDGEHTLLAEVAGFHEDGVRLLPLGEIGGVHPGSMVEPLGRSFGVDVGPGLLGRVLNGLGNPIDGKGDVAANTRMPLVADPPSPLKRQAITRPLETGVRALDGMMTIAQGQRVGIYAGSGVGKSTLLGMIARYASADVNVIALLGERGREVREFMAHSLGEDGLARSVVVVATGDEAALIRARGALVATSIAEYFRDAGKNVLLMLDSITRVAMAWREIGLAVGEPPTTKGYPPSVFASLPRLLERAGNGAHGGITGIYTVLVEGDDFNEPVADATRSILDGHVVLSRQLATAGHYPAIDVLESVSRVRDAVISPEHRQAAIRIGSHLATYREREDLISVGAYQEGADPAVDRAIEMRDPINAYLRQDASEHTPLADSRDRLMALAGVEGEDG